MRTISSASAEAFSQLKAQRNPNDNSLPDDFILLISFITRQWSDKDNLKTKKNSPKEKLASRTIYPSDQERIEHAKNIVSKDMGKTDKVASTLFTNFEELTKIASVRLYREILNLRFTNDDLVPTNQFASSSSQTTGTTEIDSNFF